MVRSSFGAALAALVTLALASGCRGESIDSVVGLFFEGQGDCFESPSTGLIVYPLEVCHFYGEGPGGTPMWVRFRHFFDTGETVRELFSDEGCVEFVEQEGLGFALGCNPMATGFIEYRLDAFDRDFDIEPRAIYYSRTRNSEPTLCDNLPEESSLTPDDLSGLTLLGWPADRNGESPCRNCPGPALWTECPARRPCG